VVNIRLNSTMFELAEPDAMRLAEMIRFHANEAAEAILAGKGE